MYIKYESLIRTIFILLFFMLFSALRVTAEDVRSTESWVEVTEEEKLDKIYDKIRKLKKEGIEFYYHKETVIQGPRDERGYLKHLLVELEKALKQGKKYGEVRRVEDDLVEIDKGAIHKVRERDVYYVYDSSGEFKSKLEIGAIADAISIGKGYEVKRNILTGDQVKFIGNRKNFELGGMILSAKEGWAGNGVICQWNFMRGWGVEFSGSNFSRSKSERIINGYIYKEVALSYSLGIKKYYHYLSIVSPCLGAGISYFSGSYFYYYGPEFSWISGSIREVKPGLYFSIGLELFSSRLIHISLESRYFYSPIVKTVVKKEIDRPMVLKLSV